MTASIASAASPVRGVLLGALVALACATTASADWRGDVERIAGADGVVVVADADGRRIVDIHGERAFVPASTLKVLTAWVALERLGADHRFETRFEIDGAGRLAVVGGGDPMLVSEELAVIAAELAERAPAGGFTGIVLDDSRFAPDIEIPGLSGSTNPYDARNGGLAVNFNTIQVAREGGRIVSAEPQTPLTPLATRLAAERGVRSVERINLGRDRERTLRYAGELLAALLRRAGVRVGDEIAIGGPDPTRRPLLVHRQSRPLSEILRGSLEFSNNFTINQVLLAMGLEAEGEPATLDKGLRAMRATLAARGVAEGIRLSEGSGISRDNRATAGQLLEVLAAFEPHRELLPVHDGFRHKTGSLHGIRTLVAYVEHPTRGRLRCVLSLGGRQGADRFRVLGLVAAAPLPARG